MNKRDIYFAAAIGGLVGIFSQPILANFIVEVSQVIHFSHIALRISLFFFFLILAPLALWLAYLLSRLIPPLYQFAKFSAVGSLNSFVDLGVFNLETLLLGAIPGTALFAVFKSVSFLLSTTNSFFWNKHWTFESREKTRAGQVFLFYAIAISGGFLNVGVATFAKAHGLSFIPENAWVNLAAPILGIFSALFWNFFGYKFFVFKKKRLEEQIG